MTEGRELKTICFFPEVSNYIYIIGYVAQLIRLHVSNFVGFSGRFENSMKNSSNRKATGVPMGIGNMLSKYQ